MVQESYLVITLARPEGFLIKNESDIVGCIQAAIRDGDAVLAVLERNIYDITDSYIEKREER